MWRKSCYKHLHLYVDIVWKQLSKYKVYNCWVSREATLSLVSNCRTCFPKRPYDFAVPPVKKESSQGSAFPPRFLSVSHSQTSVWLLTVSIPTLRDSWSGTFLSACLPCFYPLWRRVHWDLLSIFKIMLFSNCRVLKVCLYFRSKSFIGFTIYKYFFPILWHVHFLSSVFRRGQKFSILRHSNFMFFLCVLRHELWVMLSFQRVQNGKGSTCSCNANKEYNN